MEPLEIQHCYFVHCTCLAGGSSCSDAVLATEAIEANTATRI